MGLIKKANGKGSSGSVLLKTNFPDCKIIEQEESIEIKERTPSRLSGLLAGKILTHQRIGNQ